MSNDNTTIVNWVTLTTAFSLPEADVLRSQLESNGIQTFLPDEGVVSVNCLYTGAIGGVRIQVDARDLEVAREILNIKDPAVDKGIFVCPECGSDSVATGFSSIPKILSVLCIICFCLPFLWFKRQYTCRACGYSWKGI